VVAGRGTFEPAGGWGGDHHGGVPISILSRSPAPAWAAGWPAVHHVRDLEAAVRAAKHAAGAKDVLVYGPACARTAFARIDLAWAGPATHHMREQVHRILREDGTGAPAPTVGSSQELVALMLRVLTELPVDLPVEAPVRGR
jgi:hypothetical protein